MGTSKRGARRARVPAMPGTNRRRGGFTVVAGACLIAAPRTADRPNPQGRGAQPEVGVSQRPNVIVLLTDDQRADAFSAAGNALIRTPALADTLAAMRARWATFAERAK